jgi:hypothetical protein
MARTRFLAALAAAMLRTLTTIIALGAAQGTAAQPAKPNIV